MLIGQSEQPQLQEDTPLLLFLIKPKSKAPIMAATARRMRIEPIFSDKNSSTLKSPPHYNYFFAAGLAIIYTAKAIMRVARIAPSTFAPVIVAVANRLPI